MGYGEGEKAAQRYLACLGTSDFIQHLKEL